ncbi:hypothetical protein ScalyP_jg11406 [Parmales sp. scaly parma]|nr:hypothetical protein ScalyP_jg11406 [Parmales sp. scaly parma]
MSPQYPFEVFVSKEDFKFNASHFVAYRNYRERIHGHNYKVSVRLIGERIQEDGYLLDFGDVKRAVRKLCKEMNEHFICPMLSDVIEIREFELAELVNGNPNSNSNPNPNPNPHLRLLCEDKTMFIFPSSDCLKLPISHATTEELSVYLFVETLKGLNVETLKARGIRLMEVTVAEAEGQQSVFRSAVDSGVDLLDKYIPKSSGSSSSHTRASAERCQSFQVGCASCSGVSFLP